MALSTQPYKGTRDFYPEDQRIERYLFDQMRSVAESFGFLEYNGPMLEPFELYAAKSGQELVEQQLYWLIDRGDRKMAIRPEMTPTLARMVAGRITELPKPVRWYSIPNLWRYERPQRGRLREHWQLNVDTLGGDPLEADAEILEFALELIEKFGGRDLVEIRINHRGMMDHFFQTHLGLSPTQALQVGKLIDARPKLGEEVYREKLGELGLSSQTEGDLESYFFLSLEEVQKRYPSAGAESLLRLFQTLRERGLVSSCLYDPFIMRGLDYYTSTVFEMFDKSPENRRAMFGGGRYDNLIGLFGHQKLSGVGLGLGDVTLRNFLETHSLLPEFKSDLDLIVGYCAFEPSLTGKLATQARRAGLRCATLLHQADLGFGTQIKQALKLGAHHLLLFGEAEFERGEWILKDLQSTEQKLLTREGFNSWLQSAAKKRS
jgi:histidyl-tRNA synthetase